MTGDLHQGNQDQGNPDQANQYHLEEYKEINNNLRHYGNVTITLISVFFVFNTGFAFIVFRTDLSNPTYLLSFKILAIVTSLFFLAQELSAIYVWTKLIARALYLEREHLRFAQYRSFIAREGSFLFYLRRPATFSILMILISFILFWVVTIITPQEIYEIFFKNP